MNEEIATHISRDAGYRHGWNDAKKETSWIDINDLQPDARRGQVLYVDEDGVIGLGHYLGTVEGDHLNWRETKYIFEGRSDRVRYQRANVTHWMKLPESPSKRDDIYDQH